MIEIIKQGIMPPIVFQGCCAYCDAVLRFELDDALRIIEKGKLLLFRINCPACLCVGLVHAAPLKSAKTEREVAGD